MNFIINIQSFKFSINIIFLTVWLMKQKKAGVFVLKKYEDKTKEQIEHMQNNLVKYISGKRMIEKPNCSYAKYIMDKFPDVWDKYVNQSIR